MTIVKIIASIDPKRKTYTVNIDYKNDPRTKKRIREMRKQGYRIKYNKY